MSLGYVNGPRRFATQTTSTTVNYAIEDAVTVEEHDRTSSSSMCVWMWRVFVCIFTTVTPLVFVVTTSIDLPISSSLHWVPLALAGAWRVRSRVFIRT